MATDLQEINDLATWPTFLAHVRSAMIKASVAIGNEVLGEDPYTNRRQALTQMVFSDPNHWAIQFAWAAAANASITYQSSDSDIEWTVNSVWDALAGARKPATPDPATTPSE